MPSKYPALKKYKECLGLTWSSFLELIKMLAEDKTAGPILARLIAKIWLTDYRSNKTAVTCKVGALGRGESTVECKVRHPVISFAVIFEVHRLRGGRWRICDPETRRCLESEKAIKELRNTRIWLNIAARRLLEERLVEEAMRRARHCPFT